MGVEEEKHQDCETSLMVSAQGSVQHRFVTRHDSPWITFMHAHTRTHTHTHLETHTHTCCGVVMVDALVV